MDRSRGGESLGRGRGALGGSTETFNPPRSRLPPHPKFRVAAATPPQLAGRKAAQSLRRQTEPRGWRRRKPSSMGGGAAGSGGEGGGEEPGGRVVYVGHVPHGFYEKQMLG